MKLLHCACDDEKQRNQNIIQNYQSDHSVCDVCVANESGSLVFFTYRKFIMITTLFFYNES